MTLRQYWKAVSFRPCLDFPPAPRAVREAIRDAGPEPLREERRGEGWEMGRELVGGMGGRDE